MFSTGDDVEAHALRKRGWSISAIARHLGHDRKTVRDHLSGKREPGTRRRPSPDPLEPFVPYLTARFTDDAHVWASALFDEVVELGYARSYPSFVRQVRSAGLRPHCEACSGVTGRDTIDIFHPPGGEVQWDWFERRRAPWGGTAYVLLGTLPHSGRTRGVIASCMDQAHLIEAMDGVLRRLGGTPRHWRVDRMATVIVPGTTDVQASFAPVAKFYGAFFRRIAAELNVEPRRIAYVGDRIDNDVLPAKSAGMRAVFIRRGPWGHLHAHRPDAAAADLRIDGLASLGPTLLGL